MKRLTVLIASLLLLIGCSYMGEHHKNAMTCLNDPACKSEVDNTVNPWKAIAGASGYPVAGVAVGIIGTYLVAFFKKKKEPK